MIADLDLTVVIPAYNSAATIAECVRSARDSAARTVLVVDDGSTDVTADVASRAGAIVIQQANSGASIARAKGIAVVETEFVLLLDADDLLRPDGVRAAIGALRGRADAGGVVGRYAASIAPSAPFPHWREGVSTRSLLVRGQAPAPPGAVLWRTELLLNAKNLSTASLSPRWAEDYETLLRGSMCGQIAQVDDVMCVYEVSGGKSSVNPKASLESAEAIRRHYSRATGIQIVPRSAADLSALVLSRRAMSETGVARVVLLARSVLRSPVLYARLCARRVARNRSLPTE
jgi:glycosyltransferase involved in cell wall biosynthesis